MSETARDPFHRLAIACAVLCACGPDAKLDMWIAANQAVAASLGGGWGEPYRDDLDFHAGERLLRDAYGLAQTHWRHPPARDLLWAAVQIYGIVRAINVRDVHAPEARPHYWWQDQ
jgi:hypothetical protein